MKTKLSFVALLCMMFLYAVSCKKEDPNGGDTPNPTEADFFIDVDFLPKTETHGEVAPRMIINFNNEMMVLEIRPSADTLLETMLFLCPDNEAMMVCGNENLMICAAYDMETYTASDNVLLVTQMDDNTLLLTQCVMDWNTNTMTTGDMMVLPIDDDSKSYRNKGVNEDDWRIFFMNRFMKPLVKRIEKVESITGSIGLIPASKMFSIFKYVLTTEMPIILFSDDPELLMDYMEYPFVTGAVQGSQNILLRIVPKEDREMASCLVSALGLFTSNGYGNNNVQEPPMSAFFAPAYKMTYAATQIGTNNPEFAVYLNVSNITENSVYLKGYINYGINHIMPVDMGYVYKISGDPEPTEEDMGFQGKTLSGLQKATKYTVYAYARSMDKLMKSPAVTFWTLGFEVFPNSLTFPAEGDTKNVALSYSHEDITSWEITSKPSWCTTSIDYLGLLAVTVDASTETRNGTITVTAHSNALGTLTESISVTQLGSNPSGFFTGTPFDNTSWNVPVSYETTTTGIRRIGDWHSDPNGIGGYYTYHNENFSETGNGNDLRAPSFINNTYYETYGGYVFSYEFMGDSIISKLIMPDYVYINGFVNDEQITFESDDYIETIILSRFFVNSNTFCIKSRHDGTFEESGSNNNDWFKYHHVYEELTTFTINESTNTCIIDINRTSTMNVLNYGREYTGTLSENSTTTWHGTGTFEYGVQNNVVNQGGDLNNLMSVPEIPMKKHK